MSAWSTSTATVMSTSNKTSTRQPLLSSTSSGLRIFVAAYCAVKLIVLQIWVLADDTIGYHEVRCQLCAVSFNVGRSRTINEPREAGWGRSENLFDIVEMSHRSLHRGCQFISHRREEEKDRLAESDDDDSSLYSYQSEQTNEPYEYESDDDLVSDRSVSYGRFDQSATDEYKQWQQSTISKSSTDIRSSIVPDIALPADPDDAGDSGSDIEEAYAWGKVEHVAGPDCPGSQCYNGHKITAEEMKGSKTAQSLMYRYNIDDEDAKSERADLDFDIVSGYFLSGLCDSMPSTDMNIPHFIPVRHGVSEAEVYNYKTEAEYGSQIGREKIGYNLPFHPACFDMFIRLSRQRFGFVDVAGLIDWRDIDYRNYSASATFPRHPDVVSASDQEWQHRSGAEYLAANPVLVPYLATILETSRCRTPIVNMGSKENGRSSLKRTEPQKSDSIRFTRRFAEESVSAPLQDLPLELLYKILALLEPRDLANIRSVSTLFWKLPVKLWHELVLQEMPWLWEVHNNEPPMFWTKLTADEIEKKYMAGQNSIAEPDPHKTIFEEELEVYRTVIGEEMPELFEKWREAEPQGAEIIKLENEVLQREPWPPAVKNAGTPSVNDIDWCVLYTSIKRNWHKLKGLQNRQRIWNDVTEIVNRIERYRMEGRIKPVSS